MSTAVSLAIFVLVIIWLATIVYTYLDARRRIEDPFLVGCATVAAMFPFIGTAVYAILRPPELVADARERDLDVRTTELRLRHLTEQSCPNCAYPIEKNFLRCPSCERHLKDPCESCNRPVDPRWALCPYCEAELPGKRRGRQEKTSASRGSESSPKRRSSRSDAKAANESGRVKSGDSDGRGRAKAGDGDGRGRTKASGGTSSGGSTSGAKKSKAGSGGSRSSSGGGTDTPAKRSSSSRKAPANRDR